MEVETTKLTTLFIGLLGLIILPLGFIWASNTIFQLNLEYTFLNWLAVLFLQLYFQVVVRASTTHSNKNKTKK
jgi:hypothetical protein